MPNINYNEKKINLSGEIIENNEFQYNTNKKLSTKKIKNYNNRIHTFNANNPVMKIPTPQIDIKDDYIQKTEISPGNIKVNNSQMSMPLNYNINMNMPMSGIRNHNSYINNEDSNMFYTSGYVSPPKNNQNQNISYYTNNIQISNNNQNENIHNSYHRNLNDINYSGYHRIKGSRMPLYYSHINNDNDINNQIKLSAQAQKLHNIVVKKMEILPQEKSSIIINDTSINNNSPNKASNFELHPSQIENNNNIYMPDSMINNDMNLNTESYNLQFKIENNLDNQYQYSNSNDNDNNNNVFNNNNEIQIEMPKPIINSNYMQAEIPKFNIQNNNNISKSNYQKLNYLAFKGIEDEEQKSGNYEENAYYGKNVGSNRVNSRKKNKDLPLVSMKNNEFNASKVGIVGKLNTENIDINNLKMTNVGVNGIKIGDRIIE
jgi:hypothetical protein